jgi:hypothetical protein
LRPYLGERIETARISDAAGKQMALDLYAAPDARLGPGNK